MAPLIGFNYHWPYTQEAKMIYFKAGRNIVEYLKVLMIKMIIEFFSLILTIISWNSVLIKGGN